MMEVPERPSSGPGLNLDAREVRSLPGDDVAEVPAIYLTDDRRMAAAYASGRKRDAHGGARIVRDGVVFKIALTGEETDIGGDVWQAWREGAEEDLSRFARTQGPMDDSTVDLLEAAGLPPVTTAEDALERIPQIAGIQASLSADEWLTLQHQHQGYAELAVQHVPWDRIISIEQYDKEGNITRTIHGGCSPYEAAAAEAECRIAYHGSPAALWSDRLDTLEESLRRTISLPLPVDRSPVKESVPLLCSMPRCDDLQRGHEIEHTFHRNAARATR